MVVCLLAAGLMTRIVSLKIWREAYVIRKITGLSPRVKVINLYLLLMTSKKFGYIEFVRTDCRFSSFCFTLVCTYCPPTSVLTDDLQLVEEIKAFSKKCSHLVICVDFNFPNISWQNISITEGDLKQLVSFPMRFRVNQNPWSVDLILTNHPNLLTTLISAPPIGISDNCIIETAIQYHLLSLREHEIRTRLKTDFTRLQLDLISTNWEKVYNNVFCDEAVSIFSVRLEELTKMNTVVCRTKYNVKNPGLLIIF